MAEQRQAATWITVACVRVAEGCFELAGSRAVYESSSLQRRVRDLCVPVDGGVQASNRQPNFLKHLQ